LTVFVLLLHSLSAFLLLGALSHQTFALWWPPRAGREGWWESLRAVHARRYAGAVVLLFLTTTLLGMLDYPVFRVDVRAAYLDEQVPWATGLFEIKEHATAIGLALLPAYWILWREAVATGARRAITTLLTLIGWWNFFVGHITNNLRGLG
jgi:hypothetical protein